MEKNSKNFGSCKCFFILATIQLAFGISCATHSTSESNFRPPDNGVVVPVAPFLLPGDGKIPAPGELEPLRRPSVSQTWFGSDYDGDLPNALVNADLELGVFEPDWLDGEGEIAFAMYSLNLLGMTGGARLSAVWEVPPANGGTDGVLWFGLASWDRNRWDWFAPEGVSQFDVADISAYLETDGTCVLVVVVLGQAEADLLQLHFDNLWPAAEVIYSPGLPASAQNAHYSPDGSQLLFTMFHNGYNLGPAGLFLLPLSGGEPVTLLDEPDTDSVSVNGSAWNVATNRITFASDRVGSDEVWTINPDGTGAFQVTIHASPPYFLEPTFSPDGLWVVFEVDNEAPEELQQGSIWKTKSDGSTSPVVLVDGMAGDTDNRLPVWSPLGDKILFQRREAGTDLWYLNTMAIDGTGITQITTGGNDTDASWSPDGEWVAFSSSLGLDEHPSIFVTRSDGSGLPIQVTHDWLHENGAPAFSPDMAYIAFESHVTGDESSPSVLQRVPVPELP